MQTRSRPRRARGAALALVLLAGALPAGAAAAPPLYPSGPPTWSNDPSWTVSAAPTAGGAVYGITVPAQVPAIAGRGWVGSWGCPAPGTELADVAFAATRFHPTPSGAELQVLADGKPLWRLADRQLPLSGGGQKSLKNFLVPLPAGTCSATLRLVQGPQQAEGQRAWAVAGARTDVRDLIGPEVQITALPTGWVTGNQAQISWSATANLGSPAIGEERVLVAGQLAWRGAPGQCACGPVALSLASIPDGAQIPVELQVDGNGVPGARAEGAINLDRTPPVAEIAALATGPDSAAVPVGVADLTSGAGGWIVYANAVGGPIVASSAAPQLLADVDLSTLAPPGGSVQFVLVASDLAGNAALAISNPIERAPLAAPPAQAQGAAAAPVLPDLSRVRAEVSSPQTVRELRLRGVAVPVLRASVGGQVSARARFLLPHGPLRRASVRLIDPSGRAQGSAVLTDAAGVARIRFSPARSGVFTLEALGRPSALGPVVVELRPRLELAPPPRAIRAGQALEVRGRLLPLRAAGGKTVQLQVDLHGRWISVDQAQARSGGRFGLAFPTRPGARFPLRARVAVSHEIGWPFSAIASAPFTVRVGG